MGLRTFSFSALRGGRWFVSQVAVAVAATICVAALFPSAKAPQPVPAAAATDGMKSAQRIGNGDADQAVLRPDPQQQAALASFASFTPHAAAASPVPVVAARTASTAKATAAILPPRRPVLSSAAPADPVAAPVAAGQVERIENWTVAGVSIPGSGTIRRYVPSGSDIVATGNTAWTATTAATKSVARKVGDLGGLLGL